MMTPGSTRDVGNHSNLASDLSQMPLFQQLGHLLQASSDRNPIAPQAIRDRDTAGGTLAHAPVQHAFAGHGHASGLFEVQDGEADYGSERTGCRRENPRPFVPGAAAEEEPDRPRGQGHHGQEHQRGTSGCGARVRSRGPARPLRRIEGARAIKVAGAGTTGRTAPSGMVSSVARAELPAAR